MAQATVSTPLTTGIARTALAQQYTPQSQWALAWRRFKRNRLAIFGAVIVIVYIVAGFFANILAPHNPLTGVGADSGKPPVWTPVGQSGKAHDPKFLFGTDSQGRDVLTRILYGTRSSLAAGIVPVALIMLIGLPLGLIAGLRGGATDNVIMRIVEVFYALPTELFLILTMVTMGDSWFGKLLNGMPLFLSAIAIVSWSGLARLMRGSALALRHNEFVDAARSLGATQWHIVTRHILPNTLGILVVWAAFAVPRFILAEAVLGYIGLGLRPSLNPREFFLVSWGRLFLDAYSYISSQPGFILSLSAAVALFVISFTFFGDGLRDALDPRMTKK